RAAAAAAGRPGRSADADGGRLQRDVEGDSGVAMAMRGTLYRCHLCSFLIGGRPQTEGIRAMWRQGLHPAGDAPRLSGERVELFVTVDQSPIALTPETPIRFDLLEEDVVSDDLVGSICCGPAVQKDPDFDPVDYRKTHSLLLREGERV